MSNDTAISYNKTTTSSTQNGSESASIDNIEVTMEQDDTCPTRGMPDSTFGQLKVELASSISPNKSRVGGSTDDGVCDSMYNSPPPRTPLDVMQDGSSRTLDSIVSCFTSADRRDSHSDVGSPLTPMTPTSDISYAYENRIPTVKITTKVESIMDRARPLAVNEYRFLKTIGKGAYAEVKLATLDIEEGGAREGRPVSSEERYAVKIIKKNFLREKRSAKYKVRGSLTPGNSPHVTAVKEVKVVPEEVLQEIQIMKHLSHPQLVKLHEIIDDDTCKYLYLVMEYVEAGPIMTFDQTSQRFVCKLTNGVLLEAMARKIFKELMNALAYLHMNHIAHRDLKPDNLLVDFNGNLKVTDFGVSSHFSDEKRKTAINLRHLPRSKSRGIVAKTEGTFPFYSPEMCQENAQTYSAYMSDVWAASVCLWIFVFGKLPFYHPDVVKLFAMIRVEDPSMPHRLSPELEDLFRYLLKKNVRRRLSVSDIQHHCWLVGVPLEMPCQRTEALMETTQLSERSVVSNDTAVVSLVSADLALSPIPPEDLSGAFTGRIRKKLSVWAASARATCAARKAKLVRTSHADINVMIRKSAMAMRSTPSQSSGCDGNESDPFSFSDASDVHSDGSDDPLARVVSYDDISPATLQDILAFEKKNFDNQVRSAISTDCDDRSKPNARDRFASPAPSTPTSTPTTPNVVKKPLRAGRRNTGDVVSSSPVPVAARSVSAISSPLVSSGTGKVDSPMASISSDGLPRQKKPLRTGRKKVSMTANGELQPVDLPLTSTESVNSRSTSTSIERLDEIMRKLDENESRAAVSANGNEKGEQASSHVTAIQSCGCSVM